MAIEPGYGVFVVQDFDSPNPVAKLFLSVEGADAWRERKEDTIAFFITVHSSKVGDKGKVTLWGEQYGHPCFNFHPMDLPEGGKVVDYTVEA